MNNFCVVYIVSFLKLTKLTDELMIVRKTVMKYTQHQAVAAGKVARILGNTTSVKSEPVIRIIKIIMMHVHVRLLLK